MAGLAEVAELSNEGNPTLKTTLVVMKALGTSLTAGVVASVLPASPQGSKRLANVRYQSSRRFQRRKMAAAIVFSEVC